eukprot:s8468_g4.t1
MGNGASNDINNLADAIRSLSANAADITGTIAHAGSAPGPQHAGAAPVPQAAPFPPVPPGGTAAATAGESASRQLRRARGTHKPEAPTREVDLNQCRKWGGQVVDPTTYIDYVQAARQKRYKANRQKRKQRWANKWGDKKGKFGEDKKGGDDDDDDDEDDEEDAAGNKKKAPVPLDEHKPLDDGSGKRFGGDAPPVLVG